MSQTLSSSPVDSGSDHAASAGSNPGCLDHVVQDCRASRNRSPLPEYPSEKKWVRRRKGSTNTHAPGDGKEPRDERWDESQLGYQQMEEAVLRCDEGLSAAENGKLSGSRTPDPFVLTSVPLCDLQGAFCSTIYNGVRTRPCMSASPAHAMSFAIGCVAL